MFVFLMVGFYILLSILLKGLVSIINIDEWYLSIGRDIMGFEFFYVENGDRKRINLF